AARSIAGMRRCLLRRLWQAAFLLIGVSVLAFAFTVVAPGNYFDGMRLNPQIAPETITALRAQYELDRPLPVRYAHCIASLLHRALVFSFAYNSPVAPLLLVLASITLLLTITDVFLTRLIAMPLIIL